MPALVQDLPQEILGEIFVWCLPRIGGDSDHPSPNSRLPPLVLCHICSSWRKAALGTPQLWQKLSMKLERASVRSIGGGFLRANLNMLEFWSSHMGALLPSLHFYSGNSRTFISYQDRDELVSFETFFHTPVISSVQSLTLSGFSSNEVRKLSALVSTSFNNLEYLSIMGNITHPHHFSACPNLRRLQIGFNLFGAPIDVPWMSITHLNANLDVARQDWYTLLAQCVNMTSCSVVLNFRWEPAIDRPATTFHHNLRMVSVQGFTRDFDGVFNGFVFPSLVALRLSSIDETTMLRDVHKVLTAAPALKELHLQFHSPFEVTRFLQQPVHLAGSLYKFAPGLVTLVIDQLASCIRDSTLTLLHSNWLNDDRTTLSRTQLSVEFVFGDPSPSLVKDFNQEISVSLPFHASARYGPSGLWTYWSLSAHELRQCWDDFLGFSSC